MEDKNLYGSFTKEEMEKHTQEARQKWGNTEAFKQSQERVKKMGKEGLDKALKEGGKITEGIARQMKEGKTPENSIVQILIDKHYNALRAFYEPNLQIYRGLAKAYVADERFKQNYEKVAKELAQFMHDAMMHYANQKEPI